MTAQLFNSGSAARLANITIRQLDYWIRTEILKPVREASGSGSRRKYSLDDVLRLRVARELAEIGSLRPAGHLLAEITMGSHDQVLVGVGDAWWLVSLDQFSLQLIAGCGPQAVTILSLGAFVADVQHRLETIKIREPVLA